MSSEHVFAMIAHVVPAARVGARRPVLDEGRDGARRREADDNALLDRRLFPSAAIDHMLRLPPGTTARWLHGAERWGVLQPPVLRAEATTDDRCTWGELVTARLLAEVAPAGGRLERLRPVIAALAIVVHPRAPLACAWPFRAAAGRAFLLRAQEAVCLERPLRLVEVRDGLIVPTAAAERFLAAVEHGPSGIAVRLRPVAAVPDVVIDPRQRIVAPAVQGLPTVAVADAVRAGATIDEAAERHELSRLIAEAAIRFELRGRPDADVEAVA